MRKLALLLLLSSVAFGQKFSLEQRASPAPSGAQGDIPYASSTTTIGWIPHATGLQCLTQNGSATPTWAACSSGSSPLTTKGDIYVYSTLDTRLPVGTNGYVLMADSTQTTGLKWNDPNTSAIGWVRLQASYPGSQQTGSFNVNGASGSGPYTITYPTPTAAPSTIDLLTLSPNASNTVLDRYRIMFGDATAGTAKQLAFSYLVPSTPGGEAASWNFVRADKNVGAGITMLQQAAATNMSLCIATDGAAGSGYPTVCDAATAPFAVGVTGGAAAFVVTTGGDVTKLRGVSYTWPAANPGSAACLRNSGAGTISWDTTCGSGATGGVTSVGLSLPAMFTVSGSPVTSTGTLTGTLATQTANTVFAGPTSGGVATPTFRSLVSADIPNNAADTTGKSGTTNALATTGASVNVSLAAAPPGAGYTCTTTDATHCTWQAAGTGTVTSIATTAPITGGTITGTGTIAISSFATTAPSPGAVPDATGAAAGTYLSKAGTWTVPTGTGGVTVATKGDIQTFTTVPANLGVGSDGQVLFSDSTASTGLRWKTNVATPGIFTWTTVTRTSGTVYQNTSSYPMLVIAVAGSTGAGNVEIFSDASNPPTTSRSKTSNQNTYGLDVYTWVLPSHYYKITATTATLGNTTEYTFTKGTLTDSGDLSGSRAYATAYQNTSGKTRFVQIEVGTSGTVTAATDASNPPTTNTMAATIQSGVGTTLMFPVLDNHYYKVTAAGGATIVKWYEYDLSGVTVTKSSSMAARVLQSTTTPSRSYLNLSGKSVLVFYSGHGNGVGTTPVVVDSPLGGFSTGVGVQNLNYVSYYTAAANNIRPVICGVNPNEAYQLYFDTGTVATDTYYEFTLE